MRSRWEGMRGKGRDGTKMKGAEEGKWRAADECSKSGARKEVERGDRSGDQLRRCESRTPGGRGSPLCLLRTQKGQIKQTQWEASLRDHGLRTLRMIPPSRPGPSSEASAVDRGASAPALTIDRRRQHSLRSERGYHKAREVRKK